MTLTAVPAGETRVPVAVIGLWHLGSVTAACLAEAGHDVVAVDPDPDIVAGLRAGRPPIEEPGLAELIAANRQRLSFTSQPHALARARIAWVTFDTPVDSEDRADVDWVIDRAVEMLRPLAARTLVVVSSQLPVGSVQRLAARCAASRGERGRDQGALRFACIPENLRLGNALECFRKPERIVAGVSREQDRRELAELLAPFSAEVEWMRVESAEMTKHALNGFLATSVAFINEIAAICESVGADAGEVSRGLRSERRIGRQAYLEAGDSYAGGTLARDIGFLRELSKRARLPGHVLSGVADANTAHRLWTRRKLIELLGQDATAEQSATVEQSDAALAGRTVAVWGLTYKPGTDTLRRSSAVELCEWLVSTGANVRVHDPAVSALPAQLAGRLELCASPLAAAAQADVLVVCTAWPAYSDVPVGAVLEALREPLVIDAGGALAARFATSPGTRYVRVGAPVRSAERTNSRVGAEAAGA
jgi:UDPglucose 6-dehydrogenase